MLSSVLSNTSAQSGRSTCSPHFFMHKNMFRLGSKESLTKSQTKPRTELLVIFLILVIVVQELFQQNFASNNNIVWDGQVSCHHFSDLSKHHLLVCGELLDSLNQKSEFQLSHSHPYSASLTVLLLQYEH